MNKIIIDKEYLDMYKQKLLEYEIIFDKSTVLVFDNHMLTFMERVKENELIDSPKEDYEMILPELSDLSIDLATRVVSDVAKSFIIEPTMMEIILVATHLQANTRKKER